VFFVTVNLRRLADGSIMGFPTLDCRVVPVISRLHWLEGSSNFNGPLAAKPLGRIALEGFSATPGREKSARMSAAHYPGGEGNARWSAAHWGESRFGFEF